MRNHAQLKRIGLRSRDIPEVFQTSLEVLTGHKPARPLMRALLITKYGKVALQDENQMRKVLKIE